MSEGAQDLIGRVVLSRAGRDQGRAFLVVAQQDAQYALIADGCLRRLDKPKKKKWKHLALQSASAPAIRAKLLEGRQVFDAEIRNCLLNLGYNLQQS